MSQEALRSMRNLASVTVQQINCTVSTKRRCVPRSGPTRGGVPARLANR